MTRINCGIPPYFLADWHLTAEINEIPEVFRRAKYRVVQNIELKDVPKRFTLGTGHVLFFIDKLWYVHHRWLTLFIEASYRNLPKSALDKCTIQEGLSNVQYLQIFKKEWFNNYIPLEHDIRLISTRIVSRINESDKLPYYYGERISKRVMIDKLRIFAEPYGEHENQLSLF